MRFVCGRVLDVGCGAGRALLYLMERGIDALGIDNSPAAIEVCRQRGLRNIALRSITDLRGLGTFDTILLLGSGFGLFGTRNRARRLLGQMYGMTSEIGRVIATTRDPYATTDPDDLRYIERNGQRGRMPGQFRIRIRYRTYRSPWWDYLTVSRQELLQTVAVRAGGSRGSSMGPTDGMPRSLRSSAHHSRTIPDAGRLDPSGRSATQRHYICCPRCRKAFFMHVSGEPREDVRFRFGSHMFASL
jgi:SAM-dependent methyltransferase